MNTDQHEWDGFKRMLSEKQGQKDGRKEGDAEEKRSGGALGAK